jgi:hypothetical protein
VGAQAPQGIRTSQTKPDDKECRRTDRVMVVVWKRTGEMERVGMDGGSSWEGTLKWWTRSYFRCAEKDSLENEEAICGQRAKGPVRPFLLVPLYFCASFSISAWSGPGALLDDCFFALSLLDFDGFAENISSISSVSLTGTADFLAGALDSAAFFVGSALPRLDVAALGVVSAFGFSVGTLAGSFLRDEALSGITGAFGAFAAGPDLLLFAIVGLGAGCPFPFAMGGIFSSSSCVLCFFL